MTVTLTESDKKVIDNYISLLENILEERESSCNSLRKSIETVKNRVYPVETPPIDPEKPDITPSEGPQSGEMVSDVPKDGGDDTDVTEPSYGLSNLTKDLTIILKTRERDPYALVRCKNKEFNESIIWNVFRSIAINGSSNIEDPLVTSLVKGFTNTWSASSDTQW